MSYVAGKHKDSAQIGLDSVRIDLPETASAADIRAAILQMNDDPRVTAFIVQLPLPQGIDPIPMLELMNPAKDADGLHPTNLGELVLAVPGGAGTIDAPLPCTPRGIVAMLEAYDVPIRGQHVTIIGQGLTVGRPLGLLLTRLEATATLTHSLTEDVAAECRRADIIVAAAGVAGLVQPDWVKPVRRSSTWASAGSSTRPRGRRSSAATSTPRWRRSPGSCRPRRVASDR